MEIKLSIVEGQEKVAWERPTLDRIDIKKTLAGSSGTIDGYSPSV